MIKDASIRKCAQVGYTEQGSTLSFWVSKELLGPAQLCFAQWHGRVKKQNMASLLDPPCQASSSSHGEKQSQAGNGHRTLTRRSSKLEGP